MGHPEGHDRPPAGGTGVLTSPHRLAGAPEAKSHRQAYSSVPLRAHRAACVLWCPGPHRGNLPAGWCSSGPGVPPAGLRVVLRKGPES